MKMSVLSPALVWVLPMSLLGVLVNAKVFCNLIVFRVAQKSGGEATVSKAAKKWFPLGSFAGLRVCWCHFCAARVLPPCSKATSCENKSKYLTIFLN